MKKLLALVIWLLILGVLVYGGYALYAQKTSTPAVQFRTSPVKRGDLQASISATGTVEPQEVVDVGAQVAGQIFTFGKDANGNSIDYGSEVEEGMVLARIDESLYQADVASATAQVASATAQKSSAEAGAKRAEADLAQARAKLDQAQRDWARAEKLGPSEALAQASYDAYKSAYESAKAAVDVSAASILQMQAQIAQFTAAIAQAQATLQRAQRNLGYCTIKSPVRGVIIDRRVNIGQTVVASLNAPSLFLIAKDLRKMQVWVAVNEADIGNIRRGQPVSFTVDAYPGRVFKGEVGKIRLNASMTQNVVTYTVEIVTDNSDSKLLPYLTANVQFEVAKHQDVMMVPNAALRWLPVADLIAPDVRAKMAADSKKGGKSDRGAKNTGGDMEEREGRGKVWIVDGEYLRPVSVKTGITDGVMTEIRTEDLKENDEVVIGEIRESNSTANPFGPPVMGGKKKGG